MIALHCQLLPQLDSTLPHTGAIRAAVRGFGGQRLGGGAVC